MSESWKEMSACINQWSQGSPWDISKLDPKHFESSRKRFGIQSKNNKEQKTKILLKWFCDFQAILKVSSNLISKQIYSSTDK